MVVNLLLNKWVLYADHAIVVLWMVSRLPMLSVENQRKQDPQMVPRIILFLLSLIAVIFLHWLAVPLIFLFYIVISLAFKNRIA